MKSLILFLAILFIASYVTSENLRDFFSKKGRENERILCENCKNHKKVESKHKTTKHHAQTACEVNKCYGRGICTYRGVCIMCMQGFSGQYCENGNSTLTYDWDF